MENGSIQDTAAQRLAEERAVEVTAPESLGQEEPIVSVSGGDTTGGQGSGSRHIPDSSSRKMTNK